MFWNKPSTPLQLNRIGTHLAWLTTFMGGMGFNISYVMYCQQKTKQQQFGKFASFSYHIITSDDNLVFLGKNLEFFHSLKKIGPCGMWL